MKAYVIKNKEGKYFVTDDIFGENILNAYIWVKEQYAKLHIESNHIKDCEIVEITIAEGDLEKQLAEKDKEIEFMASQLTPHQKSMSEICFSYDRQREKEKENLKEHIKQLEKELDILSQNQIQNLNHDKEVRHQVCEEIREQIENTAYLGRDIFAITLIKAILDQIEGENK